MSRSAAEAYETQAIMTAPPAKLVAMCYDRAIGALYGAARAIEAGDIQARCDNATRAAMIISHLWSTLNMERGGEIASNLSNIYGFAMGRLPDINMHNDADAARDIIALLQPLAESWTALAARGESMPAADLAAPPGVAPGASARRPGVAQPAARPATQPAVAASGGLAISI